MPDFDRFRRKDNGGADFNDGFNDGFDDGFNDDFSNDSGDGFSDGFDDDFNDGLDDGFNDDFNSGFNDDFGDNSADGFSEGFNDEFSNQSGEGFNDEFSNQSADGFNDGFNDDFGENAADGSDGDTPVYFDDSRISEDVLPKMQKPERGKVDLKESLGVLFKALTDRFTGKGKSVRETELDGADSSFASEFDSAVDEGFAPPQEEQENPEQPEQTEMPENPEIPEQPDGESEKYPAEQTPEADQRQEPSKPEYRDSYNGYNDYSGDREDSGIPPLPDSHVYTDRTADFSDGGSAKYPAERGYSGEADRNAGYDDDRGGEEPEYEEDYEKIPPAGSAEGVFSAVAAELKKFRKRLPSFRPKVYVMPEPEYDPEEDGIGHPTLAADIERILQEQNKPDETEQEYVRMRSYISAVSTDTRIRPEDIKAPDNMDEVRAAENELYDLINEISSANERQRRRIGVYEKPPEEDPYNYRGINNERQYYSDMDVYSFDMNNRYGFESERKIDPGRQAAEMEYSRTYAQSVDEKDGVSGGTESADDGLTDDFDDTPADNAENGVGGDDGIQPETDGATRENESNGGFTSALDETGDRKEIKVRVRRRPNPEGRASGGEETSRHNAGRPAERNFRSRRKNR